MRKTTLLYSAAQALALSGAVITVSVAPLVGKVLAPSAELSTLPYGLQFASVIVCSYLLSMAMKRFGRKPVFYLACFSFALGGGLGAYSIYSHSFVINCIAHALFGMAFSAFAYFRFAATDGLSSEQTAKAVSLVTLGGVVAAFVAPILTTHSRLLIPDYAFSASYLMFIALAVLLAVVLSTVPANTQSREAADKVTAKNSSSKQNYKTELILAIYASGFGYMLMALLMMQSSLKMNAMGIEFASIMLVIQSHVLAMFIPSLFMGRIIALIGVGRVIFAGYMVMLASMLIAINFESYNGILVALIGIGLGWNMLYVGGSSLVASLPGDAHKLQGLNESAVAVLNTIGAFSAGWLFASIGWENSNWTSMFLLLPGFALLILGWLKKSTKL
ncbi:MFS transporter [uncultured Pseudoteredinibacter sp.]|uniref:MFS transporter n=1 Tax=uncultured Pseudoteredinibacter sp. TaxID=1641701 RepID=UPI002601BDC9|nr:MFS transporter [uncultured Pseudoteredinibacter sp.]